MAKGEPLGFRDFLTVVFSDMKKEFEVMCLDASLFVLILAVHEHCISCCLFAQV